MIIKILPPHAAFSALGYHFRKVQQGKAELMKIMGLGALRTMRELRAEDFRHYLEAQSALNPNVRKPQFHTVISAPDSGTDKKTLTKLACNWMRTMGYSDQPYPVFFHKDTDQAHVHIVSTRVGRNGEKIDSAFEGKRAVAGLNQLMQADEAHLAQLEAGKALAYRFSTLAQLALLLERGGYLVKEEPGGIALLKNGKPQFLISRERNTMQR